MKRATKWLFLLFLNKLKRQMKKIIYLITLFAFSSLGSAIAQSSDYSQAKSNESVLGVHIFICSTPVNDYDYVGKIDLFDILDSDSKNIEKVINKARKKYPSFDGMILKRGNNYIELIKFKGRSESIAGFKVGDKVQYESFGRLIKGEIVDIIPHKSRATVKYIDSKGNEKLDGIDLKQLNKTDE